MNWAAGSWPRFALGIFLAPWPLLFLIFAYLCVLFFFHPGEYIVPRPLGQLVSTYASRVPMFWAYLAAPLLLMALVLRRSGLTRTRHHVLGSMIAMVVIVGSLFLINQTAAADIPASSMQDALAPPVVAEPVYPEPHCGSGPTTLVMSLAMGLLLTIPALVFPRIAYGAQSGRAPEPGWRVAAWVYAASLAIAMIFLLLTQFAIMSTFGSWC